MTERDADRDPRAAMDELPSALRDVWAELDAGARRQAAIDVAVASEVQRHRRRDRRRNVLVVALATVACVGAVAGAGHILRDDDKPLTGDKPPKATRPAADPGVVPDSATPDPAGGLPWAVRVFSNDRGLDCVTVGRLRDGVLGRVQAGAFRPLPPTAAGACNDLGHEPLLAALQGFPQDGGRTVIYGLARDRGPVSVQADGRTIALRPHGQGAFVAVLRGLRHGPLVVTTRTAAGNIARAQLTSPTP
jgi:hypothetical protein